MEIPGVCPALWYEVTVEGGPGSTEDRAMETRVSLIWLGLLGIIESIDILTTALDRARGSIESMPVSAALLNRGGLLLFSSLKALLVAAAAIALVLTLRWIRDNRRHARAVYVYVISAIRMVAVALAIASLNNALLLKSLG